MTSARTLREPLEHLYRDFDYTARVEFDAIRFPLRYAEPRDRELVGLLAACLAYGRVDLFGRQLDTVLAAMGPSPAAFVTTAPRVGWVRDSPSRPSTIRIRKEH